jgi:hypothetical protein
LAASLASKAYTSINTLDNSAKKYPRQRKEAIALNKTIFTFDFLISILLAESEAILYLANATYGAATVKS